MRKVECGREMLEGVGRVYTSGRSLIIRIPKDVAIDSTFPFCRGEKVVVQIVDDELHVISLQKFSVKVAEILSE
jgi:hypothetical protein